MINVKIGGVPEHFNLPWYLKFKEGAFKSQGINLRWTDCHGGTGEMCSKLRDNDIDIAVILTEGIIKDVIDGNPSKIVQTYVSSPLIWGIHVAQNSEFRQVMELKGKQAAISRYGSGSHLMAYVNAQNLGWDLDKDMHFKLVNNLEGGVKSLVENEADYFLWERFTTKPFVDDGTFRIIGECPTPWPCFVIAVNQKFLSDHTDELNLILSIINDCTRDFKSIPNIDRIISNRYSQKLEDVQLWLKLTEWSQSQPSKAVIENVQRHLFRLNIIKETLPYEGLVQVL